MVDVDTFLPVLCVMVDDFYKSRSPKQQRPGPDASLSPSGVITLAIFARGFRFSSERNIYRYVNNRLREAFPTLPDRPQLNRLVRSQVRLIEEEALHLAQQLEPQKGPYKALHSSAMPVRDAKRRGAGWLVTLTLAGPTVWDSMRASVCSPPYPPAE